MTTCNKDCNECDKMTFEFCSLDSLQTYNHCNGIYLDCEQSDYCLSADECQFMNRE